MSRDEWLAELAAMLGVDPPTNDEVDQLLRLAAVAAHATERTAAPLACFLLGRSGSNVGAALDMAERIDLT